MSYVAINTAKIEEQAMQIMASILGRLKGQHLLPPEQYSAKTVVLYHLISAPLDVIDELPEEEVRKVADGLLLQIREGGYESFVRFPEPQATEITVTCTDKASGMVLSFVRMFNPQEMRIVCGFSIGVHAR